MLNAELGKVLLLANLYDSSRNNKGDRRSMCTTQSNCKVAVEIPEHKRKLGSVDVEGRIILQLILSKQAYGS
jgi:hypothetical protein